MLGIHRGGGAHAEFYGVQHAWIGNMDAMLGCRHQNAFERLAAKILYCDKLLKHWLKSPCAIARGSLSTAAVKRGLHGAIGKFSQVLRKIFLPGARFLSETSSFAQGTSEAP